MRHKIEQASDIGGAIRAARKAQQLRQDDAAGSIGISLGFMVKAEAGETSVQWGKLFQILQGLGVHVLLDIPEASETLFESQSKMARRRAATREFRSAERGHSSRGRLMKAPEDSPARSEAVLRAAERLLASVTGKATRSGATVKRASEIVNQATTGKRTESLKTKARKT